MARFYYRGNTGVSGSQPPEPTGAWNEVLSSSTGFFVGDQASRFQFKVEECEINNTGTVEYLINGVQVAFLDCSNTYFDIWFDRTSTTSWNLVYTPPTPCENVPDGNFRVTLVGRLPDGQAVAQNSLVDLSYNQSKVDLNLNNLICELFSIPSYSNSFLSHSYLSGYKVEYLRLKASKGFTSGQLFTTVGRLNHPSLYLDKRTIENAVASGSVVVDIKIDEYLVKQSSIAEPPYLLSSMFDDQIEIQFQLGALPPCHDDVIIPDSDPTEVEIKQTIESEPPPVVIEVVVETQPPQIEITFPPPGVIPPSVVGCECYEALADRISVKIDDLINTIKAIGSKQSEMLGFVGNQLDQLNYWIPAIGGQIQTMMPTNLEEITRLFETCCQETGECRTITQVLQEFKDKYDVPQVHIEQGLAHNGYDEDSVNDIERLIDARF